MSSNASIIAGGLDISARSINLLAAITEITSSRSSPVQLAIGLGSWLGRERLDQDQLRFCLEKAQGLVIANSNGNQFYEAVAAGTKERSIGPIYIRPSGSLGHLMAKDPYLRWMTSTIACLFEFHREGFITDVLCSLIMQSHISKDGERLREYELAWHPLRLQLKPVLEKVISGIWYNIVNSGVVKTGESGSLTSLPLPPELKSVCPRGHNMESYELGVLLSQLQKVRGEIIIESDKMVSNLTLWLTYHFRGRLKVTISGNIIYDQRLGPEDTTIEHRTQEFCDGSTPCAVKERTGGVTVYSSVAGDLKEIFTGSYDSPATRQQGPRTRQKLYQPVSYPSGAAGARSIQVLARQTAYQMVNWLLGLRVLRCANSNRISFKVLLDEPEAGTAEEDLRVNDILARVPSIINMQWGHIQPAAVVYSAPVKDTNSGEDTNSEEEDDDLESDDQTDGSGDELELDDDESDSSTDNHYNATPENILQHFPILLDFMQEVARSCRCYHCKSSEPLGTNIAKLKPGCLKHTTFMEVMTYIAHSISEAFGADDCSAPASGDITDWGVLDILRDVVDGTMSWNTWLNTAACVVLGCPSIKELTMVKLGEEYTIGRNVVNAELLNPTIVAVQHGSLAVVAPWLDLTQPLSILNCFAFRLVQGKLGILAGKESSLQTLQEDFAVIETRHTDDVQSYVDKVAFVAEEVGSQVGLLHDNSSAKSDVFLISTRPCLYKLLMRVTSGSHSRILDPAWAMIKISQPIMSISCTHPIDQKIELQASAPTLRLYTYDEILGRWPDVRNAHLRNIVNVRRDFNLGPVECEPKHGGEKPEGNETLHQGRHYYHHWSLLGAAQHPNTIPPFRVSHILDSFFKFNTALALVSYNVAILNCETACLACILENGMGIRCTNGVEGWEPNRWVICRKKDLGGNLQDEPQLNRPRKKIQMGTT